MATAQNNYGEYIIVNGKWERIGDRMPNPASYVSKEDLAEVTADVAEVSTKVADIQSSLQNVNSSISTIEGSIETINATLVGNTEAIGIMQANLNEVGGRVTGLESAYEEVVALRNSVNNLDSVTVDLAGKISNIETVLGPVSVDNPVGTRISNLEAWSVAIGNDLNHHFSELESRLNDLQINGSDALIDVKSTVTEVETQLQSTVNTVNTVETKLQTVTEQLNEVIETLPEVMSSDEIEDAINAAINSVTNSAN